MALEIFLKKPRWKETKPKRPSGQTPPFIKETKQWAGPLIITVKPKAAAETKAKSKKILKNFILDIIQQSPSFFGPLGIQTDELFKPRQAAAGRGADFYAVDIPRFRKMNKKGIRRLAGAMGNDAF